MKAVIERRFAFGDITLRKIPRYGALRQEGPRYVEIKLRGELMGRAYLSKSGHRAMMEWHAPPFGTTFRTYLSSICRMFMLGDPLPPEWRTT